MRRGVNSKRWRLTLAALLLMSLLIGCGGKVSNPCPAPEIATWTPQESQALSGEIRELSQSGKYPMTIRALRQYYAVRLQIKSCQGN